MLFKLKCKRCGNILVYDSNEERENYLECDECMQAMTMAIETKLNNIAELEHFKVIGIEFPTESGDTPISEVKGLLHPQLFGEDLKHLEEIYESESIENKKILLNIIDKVFLLLHRKDEKTYNEVEKLISDYFYDTCGKPMVL